jgi:hypothetical protein
MIDESAALLPMWMVLSAAFGFIIGDLCGDLYRHRKCLEQDNADLRAQLDQNSSNDQAQRRELKQQRGILNDIHKQILVVTKGLSKPTS